MKIKDNKLHHFSNEIQQKSKKIQINLDEKYILLNDIHDYYINNGKLENGYIKKWSDVVKACNYQNELEVNFFIKLLTNGKFKKNYPMEREHELYVFCLLYAYCDMPIQGAEKPIDIIIRLGFENIFNNLRKEAIKTHLKEKIYIKCECPCCLTIDDNYEGLYKCNHNICFECYSKWTIKTCPICRAENNLF